MLNLLNDFGIILSLMIFILSIDYNQYLQNKSHFEVFYHKPPTYLDLHGFIQCVLSLL